MSKTEAKIDKGDLLVKDSKYPFEFNIDEEVYRTWYDPQKNGFLPDFSIGDFLRDFIWPPKS
jgi:hypothetical protein